VSLLILVIIVGQNIGITFLLWQGHTWAWEPSNIHEVSRSHDEHKWKCGLAWSNHYTNIWWHHQTINWYKLCNMKNIENLYSSKPNHQPPAWEVPKPPISGEIGHCLHIIGLTTAEAPKNSPLIKVAPFFLALCRRKSSKTSRRTMPMYSSSWGTSKMNVSYF